jgi:hypothetical protein
MLLLHGLSSSSIPTIGNHDYLALGKGFASIAVGLTMWVEAESG